MKRPLQMSHDFLLEILDKDSVTVDATMGNGNDTLFLAQHSKEVFAFDIQKTALEKTKERLAQNNLTNVHLILAGHEQVDAYVSSIKAAMFNLGYLPSADKSVITQPDTTLDALEKILKRLEISGRVSIMVYYGHAGGDKERDAVLDFVKNLPQEQFTVMLYEPVNQINTPPFLIMIEKLKEVKNDVTSE